VAITTLDGAIAGMRPPEDILKLGTTAAVGRWYSTLYYTGRPGAGVAPSPGVDGAALTTYAGQIPFTNPGSGNSYLARLVGNANVTGSLLLVDRLWHNSGLSVTSTSSQAIASPTWPARDSNGATAGDNVLIGVEVSTALGAGTPTWTLGYTNQAGTAGRSFTTAAITASMNAGSFIPIGLQAGDTGVRSVESFQLSATMTSGAIHLVAYRILARFGLPVVNVDFAVDALTSGFPRMYDNTVPLLIWSASSTTSPNISAQLIVTQG